MFPLFAERFDRVRGVTFVSVARSMWWDQGVVWCQSHASRGRHKPFERSKVMEEEKSRSNVQKVWIDVISSRRKLSSTSAFRKQLS